MSGKRFSAYVWKVISFFVLIALMTVAVCTYAAYRTMRPIVENDGHIDQTYLYGEGAAIHKGVDFPVGTNTNVYAVADGTVQQLSEGYENGCRPGNLPPDPWCPAFGNFILVRHSKRHYDRTSGQIAYVYSLYAHLSQNGVLVNVGDNVTAGQHIGESDDTGNSSGPHFHFQTMINPNAAMAVTYPLNWTEANSRNPELWLSPYNGSTGTVVGKVTDANGNPVSNLCISGLQKQAGWGYEWNQTYSNNALNPDDVWGENFGTTDVTSNTYHLYARIAGGIHCNGTLYRDLGSYTVRANEITFVGLYPVYLPDIKSNYYGWNSSIVIRNNSTSKTSEVNTTFFYPDGNCWAYQSQHNSIPPQGSATVSPPPGCYYCRGSAIVVASEDVAVVVENTTTNKSYSYNGIAAHDPLNASWGQVHTDLHLPLVMYANNNWFSHLAVQNTGSAQTTVTIVFDGGAFRSYPVSPGGVLFLDDLSFLGSGYVGSAHVTAGQPLAAMASHWKDVTYRVAYAHNAYALGDPTNHLPLVFDYYSPTGPNGWATGINVRNLGSTTQVTLAYTTSTGLVLSSTRQVPGGSATNFYLPSVFPNNWGTYGIATLTAGQPLVSIVGTTKYGSGFAVSYNSFLGSDGTGAVILPSVYKNANGKATGVQVHNVGGLGTNVTIAYYYDTGGSVIDTDVVWVNSGRGATFYLPDNGALPDGFAGSAVVTASAGGARIAAIANTTNYGAGYASSTNGINR